MKRIITIALSVLLLTACGQASPEELAERNLKRQDETAIVFAQWSLEDYGIKDYDKGTAQWNVARQEFAETTSWIVTSVDSTYGKIKYIGDWNGDTENVTRVDKYLLVNGNELLNILN